MSKPGIKEIIKKVTVLENEIQNIKIRDNISGEDLKSLNRLQLECTKTITSLEWNMRKKPGITLVE